MFNEEIKLSKANVHGTLCIYLLWGGSAIRNHCLKDLKEVWFPQLRALLFFNSLFTVWFCRHLERCVVWFSGQNYRTNELILQTYKYFYQPGHTSDVSLLLNFWDNSDNRTKVSFCNEIWISVLKIPSLEYPEWLIRRQQIHAEKKMLLLLQKPQNIPPRTYPRKIHILHLIRTLAAISTICFYNSLEPQVFISIWIYFI